MSSGGHRFIGKTAPLTRIELHQEVDVFMDMAEMHIFENDGEQLRIQTHTENRKAS
jgi:hypothetical protein